MTEHTTDQDDAGSELKPRKIGWSNHIIAETLVHRRLLAHLIATLVPAESARRDLHALVTADLDRGRYLGSPPEEAAQMRQHADGILDTLLGLSPPGEDTRKAA